MKLFIFVLFALFAFSYAKPADILKQGAALATGVVTVPGGAVTGGVGAFVGSGGDLNKGIQGAEYGAKQGSNVAQNAGK
ncbi:hypothetical protein Bhyg_03859 [Pseudolycoriella hygida]|uniref:Glycine zipper 2TM domain-containing protein n=1 Tax=Pseudolycoriella hygida TaxID=35572 RepID=A0A9Q0NEE8_9DIPT|nr:hypothetical protein Bhyg_03859 [Pseudolycoriella hygida]